MNSFYARALICCLSTLAIGNTFGQTRINLATQSRNVDFTGAQATKPVKMGTALPATCSEGEMFFNSSAAAGQNLYGCTSTNVWTVESANIQSGSTALMPNTCTAGSLYFATDQSAGQQLFACSSVNVWTQMLSLGSSGALKITRGALDINTAILPQIGNANTFTGRNTFANGISFLTANAQPACTVSTRGVAWFVNGGSSADAYQICEYNGSNYSWVSSGGGMGNPMMAPNDLIIGGTNGVPVRVAAGSVGQVLTLGPSGVAWIAPSASQGSGTPWAIGDLGSIPSACTTGQAYFATNQPPGQQLFQCSAANTWTQDLSVGNSGALKMTGGALDINTAVVPQIGNANTFTGLNTFASGVSLLTTNVQPACSLNTRGVLWFVNGGSGADSYQVCEYNGSSYSWVGGGSAGSDPGAGPASINYGPFSSLPATCTLGAMYMPTTGEFDRAICTATNTWQWYFRGSPITPASALLGLTTFLGSPAVTDTNGYEDLSETNANTWHARRWAAPSTPYTKNIGLDVEPDYWASSGVSVGVADASGNVAVLNLGLYPDGSGAEGTALIMRSSGGAFSSTSASSINLLAAGGGLYYFQISDSGSQLTFNLCRAPNSACRNIDTFSYSSLGLSGMPTALIYAVYSNYSNNVSVRFVGVQ